MLPWQLGAVIAIPKQQDVKNLILRALSTGDFEYLRPDLKLRTLELRQSAAAADRPIVVVTFPETCVVSVVATAATGRQAEVGLIGYEGVVGLAAVLDDIQSPLDCYVQIPGDAIQISANTFRRACAERPRLRSLALRYAHNFAVQVSHTALAYSSFSVVERLARWLLMSHDRVSRDDVIITHESLALMLGVRRAGVTLALQDLKRRGCITTGRRLITIIDRTGLKKAAGDSYGVPEQDYRRQAGLAHT